MNDKQGYRVTSKGRALITSGAKVPAPLDYASILGILERTGDPVVVRSYLAGYLAHAVDEWLAELQAEGLIERVPTKAQVVTPITAARGEDFEREVSFASISLTGVGVYIFQERLARREPSHKAVDETVALVVEDDPDQLALASLRLGTAGYAVVKADTIQAFYERLQSHRPDAVFLDVGLPDGDGFEALAALRQDAAYAELPIIMLTVRSDPQDIARGLALGADGYVTKPYGRNTLDYVLRTIMKREVSSAKSSTKPLAVA